MRIKILLIVSIIITFCFSSCDEWLDITPKAQVNEETMFENQKGFEDVLYGVYTKMTSTSAYGANMSFGFIDALAQYYELYYKSHNLYDASKFNFDTEKSRSKIEQTWLECYNVIANCNVLLKNIDEKDPTFFTDNRYELIKGEALAIRAYVHFDLLRAFAPRWNTASGQLSIPYADSYTRNIHKQKTGKEVIDLIIKDLEASLKLLKDVDPICTDLYKNREQAYNFIQPYPDSDDFLSYRSYRMNYYAICGLLARVYDYMGDPKALDYANIVINTTEDNVYFFNPESQYSAPLEDRDVTMSNEIIFALNSPGVHKLWYRLDATSNDELIIEGLDDIYPIGDDFRKVYLTNKNEQGYNVSIKYLEIRNNAYGQKIPLMRLSEMYYIACTYLFDTDPEQAIEIFKNVLLAKGIPSYDIASSISKEEFIEEIVKEAKREFIGEGQLFFWNKKYNMTMYHGDKPVEMTEGKYTLPLPAMEVEFGNRE